MSDAEVMSESSNVGTDSNAVQDGSIDENDLNTFREVVIEYMQLPEQIKLEEEPIKQKKARVKECEKIIIDFMKQKDISQVKQNPNCFSLLLAQARRSKQFRFLIRCLIECLGSINLSLLSVQLSGRVGKNKAFTNNIKLTPFKGGGVLVVKPSTTKSTVKKENW